MSERDFEGCKEAYKQHLIKKELAPRTIDKYLRDTAKFFAYSGEGETCCEDVLRYKAHLSERYKTSTVNSYLISLNSFFRWSKNDELCVSLIRRQRRYFSPNELSVGDYRRMLSFCERNGQRKWYLIMRCLGAMGIRVGELKFITVESAVRGFSEIMFKAKLRTILIPDNLRSELIDFARKEQIKSGSIFLGSHKSAPLDASVIWRNLKRIARLSGVEESIVYPHNFRHLFARVYMDAYHNIAMLADILGHSSIETTRIYTMNSRESQRCRLDCLGL